jgi:hypothetical protein
MKNLLRLLVASILTAVLLGFASTPTNAARRVGGSAYDGTWSVAIYTQRGDCGSVRVAARTSVAAFIPRIKTINRVELSALMA